MRFKSGGSTSIINNYNNINDSTMYSQQYAHIYFSRLKQNIESIYNAAKIKWGEISSSSTNRSLFYAQRILDIPSDSQTVIFGVIFVDSPLKPCILRDLENDVCFIVPNIIKIHQ